MLKRPPEPKRAPVRATADDMPAAEKESACRDEVPLSGPRDTAVRLTRKYAEMIDGVNLADVNVGDELTLSERDAGVLIAEGWAERTSTERPRNKSQKP